MATSRRELQLQKKIVAAIKELGGVARIRAQGPYTVVGDPDVYGSFEGRHFEFEVKEPGNVVTKIQKKRLQEWQASGAGTWVVTSVQAALFFIQNKNQWPKTRP